MRHKIYSSSYEDVDQFEEIVLRMYGDYECSCGCHRPLGRPTNGTDGLPMEISYGVGRVDDEEGFDYRMFTERCWRLIQKSGQTLEEIYENYPASASLD